MEKVTDGADGAIKLRRVTMHWITFSFSVDQSHHLSSVSGEPACNELNMRPLVLSTALTWRQSRPASFYTWGMGATQPRIGAGGLRVQVAHPGLWAFASPGTPIFKQN